MLSIRFSRLTAIAVGAVLSFCYAVAAADPPSRVARLSYVAGVVSFAPAAEPDDWVQAPLNRPLFTGDRLWSDNGARAELELGTAVVRASARTSVTVLDLDDRVAQFELVQGRLNVRVRALARDETLEIDTPNLAFVVTAPGRYQIEVDPEGDATTIAVRDGRAEVYGDRNSYVATAGQWYTFYGTDLDNDYARIPPLDEFDRWTMARDARHDRAASARYVSQAMIGYEDLDQYGTWTTVAALGPVWLPRSVPAEWAPYRNGHWTWIDPWGWTWVDDAPWGFAPFHYGRWTRVDTRWGWVPGPANVRPVYAPALVAFFGGDDFSVTVRGGSTRAVGWFPLAPGEVYRPAYRVSRDYFTSINVTNTRVSNTYVVDMYDRPAAARDVRYRHRDAPEAITAVPMQALVESRPVARSVIPANPQFTQSVQRAPVMAAPAVAPTPRAIVGAAAPARVTPPAAVLQRQAVAKNPPPAAPPAFTPHEEAAGASGRAASAAAARAAPQQARQHVRVLETTAPPQAGASAEHRGRPSSDGQANVPAAPGTQPGARPPAAAVPAAAPPAASVPSASATAPGAAMVPPTNAESRRTRNVPNGSATAPEARGTPSPAAAPSAGRARAAVPPPEVAPAPATPAAGSARTRAMPPPSEPAPPAAQATPPVSTETATPRGNARPAARSAPPATARPVPSEPAPAPAQAVPAPAEERTRANERRAPSASTARPAPAASTPAPPPTPAPAAAPSPPAPPPAAARAPRVPVSPPPAAAPPPPPAAAATPPPTPAAAPQTTRRPPAVPVKPEAEKGDKAEKTPPAGETPPPGERGQTIRGPGNQPRGGVQPQ